MSPVSHYVELPTSSLNYHVLEWNPEATEMLVLVHGFLDVAASWTPLVDHLGDRFRVIAPDLRGHGKSDRVGAGGYYYFFDYIADLSDVIAAFTNEPVFLVGHSMGGSVSSYFTGTYPDAVRKLVLLEGVGPAENNLTMPERVKKWIAAWRANAPSAPSSSLEEAAARIQKHDKHLDDSTALHVAKYLTTEIDGEYRFMHDPLHGTPGPFPYRVDLASQFWKAIPCPVLSVHAQNSWMANYLDEYKKRLAYFPNVTDQELTDCGHMMHRHKPKELAKTILDFIDGSQ